jgi:hypothetical protein
LKQVSIEEKIEGAGALGIYWLSEYIRNRDGACRIKKKAA